MYNGRNNDSIYIKQRYTLYSFDSMLNTNNRITDDNFNCVYFKNFNLYRGS